MSVELPQWPTRYMGSYKSKGAVMAREANYERALRLAWEARARLLHEVGGLVAELTSTQWQEADGWLRGATNSMGERLYFVSPELIADLRKALSAVGELPPEAGT